MTDTALITSSDNETQKSINIITKMEIKIKESHNVGDISYIQLLYIGRPLVKENLYSIGRWFKCSFYCR